MDVTVIVALVTAIAAIIAPTITAFINRRADLKIKDLEIFQDAKRKAFTCFAESFSCMYHLTVPEGAEPIREALSAAYNAMIYANFETRALLKNYSRLLQQETFSHEDFLNLHEAFFSCVDALRHELETAM